MKSLKVTLVLAFLTVAFGPVALADSVGTFSLTNCGSPGTLCPAATYTFNITSTSATLTIHIDGPVTIGTNNIIQSVNLGFAPSGAISGLSLSANPAGTWSATTGSLSNSGCGSNSGAFVCAESTPGVTIVQGGTYTWTWTYNALDPNLIHIPADVHTGANYDPHNGVIVSHVGVPEPGSLLLLGSGLIGLGGILRRKPVR